MGAARVDKTILLRIRALGRLSGSEAKIAALLEKDYQFIAFETIQTLADKAGVGKATVGRFINRLGFEGYSSFIESLRSEVVARLDTPIERYSASKRAAASGAASHLDAHIEAARRNLEEMAQRIPSRDLERAAAILVGAKGTLYVMGAASSQGLAYFFHMLAMYVRDRVTILDANPMEIAHRFIDVNCDDALLAISHYRFSAQTVDAARIFAERGGKLVLVSDREHMPLSGAAAVQLVSRSESPSMFSSRIGTLLLLETLIAAMVPLREKQVYERFARFEELRGELGTFVSWPRSETEERS